MEPLFASIGFAVPFMQLWTGQRIWSGIVYTLLMTFAKVGFLLFMFRYWLAGGDRGCLRTDCGTRLWTPVYTYPGPRKTPGLFPTDLTHQYVCSYEFGDMKRYHSVRHSIISI